MRDHEGERRPGSLSKDYKARGHYQDENIVQGYEEKRFSGLSGWLRDRLEKHAVKKALGELGRGSKILDLPCGTGRFTPLFQKMGYLVVRADISLEMLRYATEVAGLRQEILGSVRCDAEALPFRDGSFDGVFCFRFLPHLPPETRKKALLELSRVTHGSLIVDYRYKYAFRSLSRWIRYRLGVAKPLRPRYSLSEISSELGEVGLSVKRWIPVVGLFSEKVVLLCQKHTRT
jgi:SAM-dependent methyltransferase